MNDKQLKEYDRLDKSILSIDHLPQGWLANYERDVAAIGKIIKRENLQENTMILPKIQMEHIVFQESELILPSSDYKTKIPVLQDSWGRIIAIPYFYFDKDGNPIRRKDEEIIESVIPQTNFILKEVAKAIESAINCNKHFSDFYCYIVRSAIDTKMVGIIINSIPMFKCEDVEKISKHFIMEKPND